MDAFTMGTRITVDGAYDFAKGLPVKNATSTNKIRDSQLSVVWTDPDFDPTMKAVYYVHVLEILTPSWNLYDVVRNNLDLPEGAPTTLQERAYSSPIWYTPVK